MAPPQYESTIIVNDDQPIAVRRKRRCSTGRSSNSRPDSHTSVSRPHGIATPPSTPKHSKKRVRFSDPGVESETASASSGLTPFIQRTSLLSTTPTKRCHSTPAKLWNLASCDAPFSGTLQFAPLRQVLDGRVKRRLRRNRLSEEVNAIDLEKRCEAKSRRADVQRLREELAAKDREVQSMRDEQEIASQIGVESGISVTTSTTLSAKVQELEHHILELERQLRQRESDVTNDPNWTWAAKDPFEIEDEDVMVTNYDNDFRESMMDDEMATTPTRLNTSFPSPPSTTPNTPCRLPRSVDTGIQTSDSFPDPKMESLKIRLESLRSEVTKLTSTLALKEDDHCRLTAKLSGVIPRHESLGDTSLDSALDAVITHLALSESQAVENANAFSALSTEVTSLGFSSCSGAEDVLATIAAQFRQARLDLEYLTPGEVVEGFENEKLLNMLLSRIRVLVEQAKDNDATIDQYHEQEISLRQQLNTRVDALREVQSNLQIADSVVRDLRTELLDKDASNAKLQLALEGYRNEVSGLESVIERMDRETMNHISQLRDEIREAGERLDNEILKHDSTRADAEGKELLITELERRLASALQAATAVKAEMEALLTSHDTEVAERDTTIRSLQMASSKREKAHGDALALRDARVTELRREVERVNEALKNAHEAIVQLRGENHGLRKENESLTGLVEEERERGKVVVGKMREQLARVLETGKGYVEGGAGGAEEEVDAEEGVMEEGSGRRGRYLDGKLARKSKKMSRRYDSGLGFLEEDDENVRRRQEEIEG